MSVSVLVWVATPAAAASHTWTTDTDFNAAGAVFTATEVIGTGTPAKVELLKDNIDWKNDNPPSPVPGTLEAPSMTFVTYDNVSLLFGGYNGSYSDKTWEYDWALNTWTEITTSPKPPTRQSAGLSYDPTQNVVVLFGGYNDSDFQRDTWEYDPVTNTWTLITPPTSPPMMVDYAFAYHASASRHILYGQNLGTGNFETWAYDASANTWANRAPSNPMSSRSGFAVAYHPGRDRTVLFGGAFLMTLLAETWEYNYVANSWNQISVSGPSARASHSMTYRSSWNAVVLFGGTTASGASQETWKYTGLATWEIQNSITKPPARRYAALAHDTENDVTILYGGTDAGGTRLMDTWSLGSAYRAAGKYASSTFDAGGSAIWGALWWNKTTQPPLTFLRFQVATSSSPTGPWSYIGPDGTVTTYYNSPGTNISASPHDGRQYFRFLADFGSTDTQKTPSMEDVTIEFWIVPAPPCLVSTDPLDLSFGVPQDKVVHLVFSEPMNNASLVVTYLLPVPPPPNPTLTAIWSGGDTIVDLTHVALFQESKVHRLQIAANDKTGNPLSAVCPGGGAAAPNPFTFVTEQVYPTITKTTPPFGFPPLGQKGYNMSRPIYVEFSEGMDPASLVWNVVPNLAGNFTATWTLGDTNLTLSHAALFQQCTQYEVQIWAADRAGLDLVPGSVPNPWTFVTECINPYIVTTDPTNMGMDVPLNKAVVITFVEPMLTSSVTVTFLPTITVTPTWTGGNTILTLTHAANFPICKVYTVTVTGTDPDGNPLIAGPPAAAPNPWQFMTLCDNPSIMATFPEDGEVDVSQTQDILIAFSDEMNTASVAWTITPPVTQQPPQWNANVLLTIPHFPFNQCTRYTVRVTSGTSLTGFPLVPGFAPNPWSFDTICTAPWATDTNPVNGSGLIPVSRVVWVNFSEPMDTTSLFVNIAPAGVTFTPTWSNGDRTVRLDHAVDFIDCTFYQILVDGLDKSGESLLIGPSSPGAPNPWEFTTICIVPFPYVVTTNPANNQQNVPLTANIVVDFSEALVPASFLISTVPGGITFTPTWSMGNTRVTLSHSTPFQECQWYDPVTVSGLDLDGNSIGNVTGDAPNPWRFRAVCVPPQILATDPANGATGVPVAAPIVVTFSEAMNPSSVSWNIVPSIALTPGWSGGNTVLTLTHAVGFSPNTLYSVSVSGQDVDGNSLVLGPVPNPWSFTTGGGLPPPGALQVIRSGNDIVLSWNAAPGASSYRVYSSLSRFSAWLPWPILQDNVPGTTYTAAGHGGDGSPHYYIVRSKDAVGTLSANSTMGAKVVVSFSYTSVRSNVYWMSIPYRSMYKRASDITNELTSSRIDVVGKWDPSTQTPILYYWFRGGWRGTNFLLNPGDGFFVGARQSFQWVINGTDGAVGHPFTFYPPPNANIHWISLPYTHRYQLASDIVREIEGGIGGGANRFIIEVARWDPLTQTLVRYTWTPTGWTGDFSLVTGEGVYFKVASTFSWTPALLTPEV